MIRPVSRLLVAAACTIAACAIPTDVCGCTPAVRTLIVRGTVLDASDRPVPGAYVWLAGVSPNATATIPDVAYPEHARTDASGAFLAFVGGYDAALIQELRIAIVRATPPDTTRLSAGTWPFRYTSGPIDTARITLRLR